MTKRFRNETYQVTTFIDDYTGQPYEGRVRRGDDGAPQEGANVVSSKIAGLQDAHTLAIDVDLPARLLPSSTPGHFHLYIDEPAMSWRQYKRVLKALMRAGIIEKGYYKASVRRRATHLRLPGVAK